MSLHYVRLCTSRSALVTGVSCFSIQIEGVVLSADLTNHCSINNQHFVKLMNAHFTNFVKWALCLKAYRSAFLMATWSDKCFWGMKSFLFVFPFLMCFFKMSHGWLNPYCSYQNPPGGKFVCTQALASLPVREGPSNGTLLALGRMFVGKYWSVGVLSSSSISVVKWSGLSPLDVSLMTL